MRAKPVVLVIAQGERGFYEAAPCLQMLEWTLRYLDMVVAGRVVVVGHARGDYATDTPQRERVRAAGAAAAHGRAADMLPPWFHLPHRPGEPLGTREASQADGLARQPAGQPPILPDPGPPARSARALAARRRS